MLGNCRADRREMIRLLIGESLAFRDELGGVPQFRLTDLWELPDETFARIVPRVDPAAEILVDEEEVLARRQGRDEVVQLFRQQPENRFVFNRFNGRMMIGQIAAETAVNFSWTEESAFAYVKDFFLRLVRSGVCFPSNRLRD